MSIFEKNEIFLISSGEKNSNFVESFYIGKGLEPCLQRIIYQKIKLQNKQKISKIQISSSLSQIEDDDDSDDFDDDDDIETSTKIQWKIPELDSSKQKFFETHEQIF